MNPIINMQMFNNIVDKAELESRRLSKVINYAQQLRQKHERQRAQALAILDFVREQK